MVGAKTAPTAVSRTFAPLLREARKDSLLPRPESDGKSADVDWAAANGGVTNGGLRGVWPPFLEISRNRPFSPFFCLFRPFPEGAKSAWEIQKTEEKGPFPQISSDSLKPPSLKPAFAALQVEGGGRIGILKVYWHSTSAEHLLTLFDFSLCIRPAPLCRADGFLNFAWLAPRIFYKEGKSAINLSNLGNFCQIWPRVIYLC